MPTMMRCDDCEHICTDEDLQVTYPDIPNLLERIAPGEPVPYGECPECGALIHPITPIPGKRAWVTINKGKFEVQCPFDHREKPDLVSDDPDEVREFLLRARADGICCSSSLDFPEEYGMLREKVDILLDQEIQPGEYHEPQTVCPKCGSANISTEACDEDDDALLRTCAGCSMQWHEYATDEDDGD